MRKAVTFRFERDLIDRARQRAIADNRSLTNYVETAVLRALARPAYTATGTETTKAPKGNRPKGAKK